VKQLQMTSEMNCALCKSNNVELLFETKDYFLTQEPFSIYRCVDCNYAFTHPIPPINQLEKYYNSNDYLSHTAAEKGLLNKLYQLLRAINLRRKEAIISTYSDPGELLDIGCGTGEFLNYCKSKNWLVTGVEPNQKARQFAMEAYHLTVYPEEKLTQLPNEFYDTITLWHVLEHVPDFNERISQIKKLIKPDGIILLALPNVDSPDANKYGGFWAGLDVPRHLHHFTPAAISILARLHKLDLVKSIPMKMDAYYVSLLSEKYLKNKIPFLNAAINGFKSNRIASNSNNFSSMIYVLKKSKS